MVHHLLLGLILNRKVGTNMAISIENLEKYINECAYNEQQKQDALKKVEEIKPKIKNVLCCFVYNRDFGKELSVLTSPSIDLKFQFYKE